MFAFHMISTGLHLFSETSWSRPQGTGAVLAAWNNHVVTHAGIHPICQSDRESPMQLDL